MIEFLKESTFAVNEVIQRAWGITRKHYLSIATLCFLMFLTSSASSLMAFFLNEVSRPLSVLMVFLFILMYFTINLSLLRYIFHLLDNEENDVTIVGTIPTKVQIVRFLIATLYFMMCIIGVYLLVTLVPFPIILLLIKTHVITTQKTIHLISGIFISIGILAIFITWLRISFFPFFILDKGAQPFESIKLSLATTKGNFTKILLLLLVLGGFQLLYLAFSYLHWPIVSFIINVLSSFIIVPLSAVSLTVAYRKMMQEYRGDARPDILHNIV
ncbi:hypothetical protein C7T94_18180 [Pedobacter yulinensis]|uniref:Beta-carotene 15,15'-monooxygenase n=1 Tax=Pedobacter yulinensis TaxID=2126353 RepID=A0A2T3HH80_9SPHI|nr:hypothetical protein [Pedobacter yulinensis]PST81798.1 hypothetical protein C7T94_18180 [Pedobacter yulinensis]